MQGRSDFCTGGFAVMKALRICYPFKGLMGSAKKKRSLSTVCEIAQKLSNPLKGPRTKGILQLPGICPQGYPQKRWMYSCLMLALRRCSEARESFPPKRADAAA
ncbi:hypothetical protein [Salipiger marinus]|uniref:hypothetical protein n=1 Tax=Salipiger marinus TaxID=555512 RepID=UPI0010420D1A|nr:hypothetical protein [Salipiger marinus]